MPAHSSNRVSQTIAGKRSITGDTAIRFGRWWAGAPRFWLNLLAQYDIVRAYKAVGALVCDPSIRTTPLSARLVQFRPVTRIMALYN